MSDHRLVITGCSLVSPYGHGVDPVLAGIGSGTVGYGPLTALDASTWPVKAGGWLPDVAAAELGHAHNKLRGMGKYIRVGLLAATQALEQAGLRRQPVAADRIGAFIATGTHGQNAEGLFAAFAEARGADDQLDLARLGADGIDRVHPWWLLATISNNLIFFVTHLLGIEGANSNYCNTPVAGGYALEKAMASLRRGEIDVALVGGADTPLNWQLISDLSRLGLLAHGEAAATVPMRPYHPDAPGAVLSDLGAYVVIETARHAAARRVEPLAELVAVACHGSFADLILPAADGSETGTVLGELLQRVPPEDPVQISASATGSPGFDGPELLGLAAATEGRPAAIGSAKPWLGHGHAGAFVAELVVTMAALRHQLGLSLPVLPPLGATPARLHWSPNGSLPHRWAVTLGQGLAGNTVGALLADA